MESFLTRRAMLLQTATLPLLQKRGDSYAYVGSFTSPARKGRGDGIRVYRVAGDSGAWSEIQQVGGLVNPAFLTASSDGKFLYSGHSDETWATAFSINPANGHLTKLNEAKTGGSNGVHQAIDPTGKFLIVANYGSGNVAVLPILEDGRLGDVEQLVQLKGQPGPHRTDQTASHPHQIVFDPSARFVIVPDKGLDRTFVFRFESGKLTEHGSVTARPASGPRHMAFHPTRPVAWILNELNSTVVTQEWKEGTLKPVQILTTLPEDFTGMNTAATLVASNDGRFLYCSNRGHDSVATFSINPSNGWLKPIGWTSSQGKTPRFMTLDASGNLLYVTNQQEDNIVSFLRDKQTGKLQPTGQKIHTGTPVGIAFSPGR